ncbi:MAG TPA: endolytic transglycosylase MltG [Candidatus Paceibacterota bacterium]|nr:endolytic transglycosylase MltG [Candidatus Paceibacterota bacterium]
MDPDKKPFHHKVRHHIIRTTQVCDAWCREARMYDRILPAAFLFGVLVFLIYFVTVVPPLNFPNASLLKVTEGTTVEQLAQILKEKNIIHSTLVYEAAAKVYGNDKVVAGEYFFPGAETALTVAKRIARGDHELIPIRVTFPDGSSSKDMAKILDEKVPDFDSDTFLAIATPQEGMLLPDTYFFVPGEDPQLVVASLENNFKLHLADTTLQNDIAAYGKSLPQVLTMASILEKEAATMKDRQEIAGLLWHRIAIGMPLQVDAVFPYIIGVNTFDLTKADLATTSAYNTYINKGLPPGPIDNPTMNSIMAAVTPVKSNYVYYLSDLQGNLHFCVTYTCQLANQKKYLGN